MADLFRVEVVALTKIASVEALAAQKNLFRYIERFYDDVRAQNPPAPEGPGSAPGLEGWLGELVDFVRAGGSCETESNRGLNAFMTSLVKYLAMPEREPTPLPISNVTLRIEELEPRKLPKQISGSSERFGSLFVPVVPQSALITGNFGKAKPAPGGQGRKRVEVSAWLFTKAAPTLAIGQTWTA